MRSMTGYAQVFQREDSQTLQLILRSTNLKYLEIFIHNLPPENILLEETIKKEVRRRISRGKVEIYIFLKTSLKQKVHIDEETLAKYISQIKRLAKKHKLKSDLRISDFLNLPQVVSWEEEGKSKDNLILSAIKKGLDRLLEFKDKEGRIIRAEMLKNLKRLKDNAERIKRNKPKVKEAVEDNKEDIDEEISLISFYVNRLEKKINSKELFPQGKSVAFLTQEVLRELNAASSKTKNKFLASLIVESKTYLERIKEQAQNIE